MLTGSNITIGYRRVKMNPSVCVPAAFVGNKPDFVVNAVFS
jgi:hypothetical protein